MSLPQIILTLLSTRDATGYDITKEFNSSLGYSWSACHQQVYRELNKMADRNFVTFILEPQEGKPDRKVYSITDLGRSSLFKWYQEPTPNPSTRDELSTKLLICGVHNSVPLQRHIEVMIEELQDKLNHLNELEHTKFSNYKELDRQVRLERLTLRRNIHNSQARINWAEEILCELKDIDCSESSLAIVG